MWIRHLIVFTAVSSCLAASFPDYPFKPATEYSKVIAKSGLAVAAIPMDDPEEQRKYFGMEMRSKGYVPVFLVIENQASTDGLLLRKEGLTYSPAGRSGSTLANPATAGRADKAVAIAEAVPTMFSIMATFIVSKSRELRQNILKRELQSATLSQGASVHGFVFVPAHWKHASRDTIHLSIPLTRLAGDETVILDVAF